MGDTEDSARALTTTPSVARNEENRSEAAMDRPSAARGYGDRSEAAMARPSVAGDIEDRSEAATARPSVAGDNKGTAEALEARPSTARCRIATTTTLDDKDMDMQIEIMECAAAYFLDGETPARETLQNTTAEAVEAADTNYGVAEANEWANGFQFPQDVLDSDLRCFRAAQLNFETMVRRQLRSLKENRLNPATINNPERNLLLDLAEGMRVPRPEGFVPNGKLPLAPLRPSYLKVARAVNKMIASTVAEKLGFLLPKALAVQTIPNLHLCTAHWTPKKGKKSGRPIGDLTFVEGVALNLEETTAASELYYGAIIHPTIEVIIRMILRFWEQSHEPKTNGNWKRLRLWKLELRGAYTLLSFRPEDAGLFGMELTDDIIYLQICGIFGWSSTPAAFQVVTRALKWEFKS